MTYQQNSQGQTQQPTNDAASEVLELVVMVAAVAALVVVALPLLLPVAFVKLGGNMIATKKQFWVVNRWQWVFNTVGVLLVGVLIVVEILLLTQWVSSGQAHAFFVGSDWGSELLPTFGWWVVGNFLAGALLLPVTWSLHRRRIAQQVRTRRISDVMTQERIESARKRAADTNTAKRIGVKLNAETGQIVSSKSGAAVMTAPYPLAENRFSFGLVNRATVTSAAEMFYDSKRVRDWVDPTGKFMVLPLASSSVRALIIAESGTGKTVLINGLILCALEYGWPVFFLDAKGDPADAEALVKIAESYGRTAIDTGAWNFFNGTAQQVTAKLMRLMPPPDGANQHYLDEVRGVLQAVQNESAISSVANLRERLTQPQRFVRDQWDLDLVMKEVDSRSKLTAGQRALQSLLVALRPLEEWIGEDGWSYDQPKADVTVIPLSPIDDAQARLGDLLLLDMRNFLVNRLKRRDKSPVIIIVDEFAQLVTDTSDPGDTAASLFETGRSAGVGVILVAQSTAGISNDETKRKRALSSGAALIIGRTKDPEEVVKFAGTAMRMEASGEAAGDELKSARAQHTYVIPPQEVREANDGSFWIIQAGVAAFRALPNRNVENAVIAGTAALTAPIVAAEVEAPAAADEENAE
ncbi:hypothetical protein [Subtercola sp. RTI3]|uniref:hypothetical protein n=1 Tax=Subtercola sp. RTI3 TaxID=3048639 RepID=UPI002B2337C4|nr:hypothetical protein [Subtercola sp. RTI3]MEA9986095.1 hypothetical protein [Subtercola sp. RTI3]